MGVAKRDVSNYPLQNCGPVCRSRCMSQLDLSLFVQYNPANQKFLFYPNCSMTKNFRFYASFYFYDNSSLVVVGGV